MKQLPRYADQADQRELAGDAGFSLLEMIVVMIIFAAIISILLPQLSAGAGRSPPTGLQSMALQVAAGLRETRAEALRSNTEQTFTLDLNNRMTWSMVRPTPRRFLDGFNVEVIGAGLDWSNNGLVKIRFQPTGVAVGGEILVRDHRSVVLNNAVPIGMVRIGVDWLTGVPRIERVQ
jgi:prepilin-type N-terminal cleavage/methylation domain-containing protein